jgi:calmodulin
VPVIYDVNGSASDDEERIIGGQDMVQGFGDKDEPAEPAGAFTAPALIGNKRVTAVCLVGIVIALAVPSSTAALEANEGTSVLAVTSNATLIILTVLVSIALFFEHMHHVLSHGTAEVYIPVLHALMGELMGIGFLAIIFYFLVKFNVLINISKGTLCQTCDPCSGGSCSLQANGTVESWGKYTGRRLLSMSPTPDPNGMWEDFAQVAQQWGGPARRLGAAPVSRATSSTCASAPSLRRLSIDERHAVAWGQDWTTNPNLPGRDLVAHNEAVAAMAAAELRILQEGNSGRNRGLAATAIATGKYTCECYHCDQAILHLFEDVHMGLFLVLVLFFARAVLLLRQVECIGERWRTMEAIIATTHDGERAVVQEFYEGRLQHRAPCCTKKSIAGLDAAEVMLFTVLRMRFVRTANGGGPLKDDFSFAEYLNLIFGKTAAHIVHIPVKAWALLELGFVVFWASMRAAPFLRVRCFALVVCAGAAASFALLRKYHTILAALTIPYDPYEGVDGATATGASSARYQQPGGAFDFEAFQDQQPSYLALAGGRGLTQHDALFWRGKKGPGAMMHAIRILQVSMLIFFVLFGFALPFAYAHDRAFFPVVVLCIPVVAYGSLTLPQELLRLHCLCTSIELQKNPRAIDDTIRTVKFAKSMRTLALLRSLQGFAELEQMKNDDGGGGGSGGAPALVEQVNAKEEDDPKGKANCKEVFDVFDADHSGEVSIDEMGSLLKTMGMELTAADLEIVIKKFDRDGDGTISFEEFWIYMKSRKAKLDPDVVVAQVFAMIDADGSGRITAEEFSDTLRKLPTRISEEDINALVREIDSSGDGEISMHEFAHVLKKYI